MARASIGRVLQEKKRKRETEKKATSAVAVVLGVAMVVVEKGVCVALCGCGLFCDVWVCEKREARHEISRERQPFCDMKRIETSWETTACIARIHR
jgi:CDGSH-type Zn-finger protein